MALCAEGYDSWLLSGRPLFDVELDKPVPQREVEGMLYATGRRFSMSWIDERVLRVESEPVMHMASRGIKSF